MTSDQLRTVLDSPERLTSWLRQLGIRDTERGHRNVVALAELGIPLELLATMAQQLEDQLPSSPDPDMALNNLERYFANCTSPLAAAALFERDPSALGTVLQLFSTSQYFSDLVIVAPQYFEWLRNDWRGARRVEALRDELAAELRALPDTEVRLNAIRRFRQAELLRVGYRDIIRDMPLEVITGEISALADAIVAVALDLAIERMTERHGTPKLADGRDGRMTVIAMGKLGGNELNYSSDIDLVFIYDEDGMTDGRRSVTHQEFWGKVAGELVRMLTAHTERGVAYRVDLRLRPEGERGPIVRSLASTLAYYDSMGRTWERQALIKSRAIAGNVELGREFLEQIRPFIYRRYLSFAEINEIKALKRRIEARSNSSPTRERGESDEVPSLARREVESAIARRAESPSLARREVESAIARRAESPSLARREVESAIARRAESPSLARRATVEDAEPGDAMPIDVKTGRGGIRDVEFVVQFLQLLNGGGLPELQEPNTVKALLALERTGCLSGPERTLLEDNYRFFRKVEHRLQTMFDLQTHTLPQSTDELEKLARRMGYEPAGPRHATSARSRFRSDLRSKAQLNRRILDHILHAAFPDDDAATAEPETDLVLAPEPDEPTIATVLGRYPFRDTPAAFRSLVELSREPVPFLSTPRCRHFLASIAPRLLRELATTPDPDMALLNLEKVTASLGARGALWELFSFNPPTLKLCVELCAWSQFLSQILINNPGMIDDLMDSLVLNQPRSLGDLRAELNELCRGAEDLEPILHSFKDKELLRIGVRDILGKDTLSDTTLALSDVAEVVLEKIVEHEYSELADRLGDPTIEEGPRAGQPSRLTVIALGKFGGQELSYHSDLDVIFIYEADGQTRIHGRRRGWEPTTNFHFYSELGTRIMRVAGGLGPHGRLYAIDPRLRPTGRSGSLVIPIDQFVRYYESGGAALWERQTLTKARAAFGESEFATAVAAAIESAAYAAPWRPELADEIFTVRQRLEESRSEQDLKRGFGGIVDIEFLVQMLQLKYGGADSSVRHPNTRIAMEKIRAAGYLDGYTHSFLVEHYDYLRRVESRLRIVHNVSRDALPDDPTDLEKLARRLGYQSTNGRTASDAFLDECERITRQTRQTFLRVLSEERGRVD
jgi:glutamate-ammonia-ligase adenylyltransferase